MRLPYLPKNKARHIDLSVLLHLTARARRYAARPHKPNTAGPMYAKRYASRIRHVNWMMRPGTYRP